MYSDYLSACNIEAIFRLPTFGPSKITEFVLWLHALETLSSVDIFSEYYIYRFSRQLMTLLPPF